MNKCLRSKPLEKQRAMIAMKTVSFREVFLVNTLLVLIHGRVLILIFFFFFFFSEFLK